MLTGHGHMLSGDIANFSKTQPPVRGWAEVA